MMTFAVFGAGFLMRPIGAIVLGAYIDKVGRRKGLIATLSIMATGTFLIVLIPSSSDHWPVGAVAGADRTSAAGFSAGAELGGCRSIWLRSPPRAAKGSYTSWQSGSQQVAIMVAAAMGFALNAVLELSAISDWGWRIRSFRLPDCSVHFFLRRKLEGDPGVYCPPPSSGDAPGIRHPAGELAGGYRRDDDGGDDHHRVLPDHRLCPTFGKKVLMLSASDSLLVTLLVAISNFFWLPVGGGAVRPLCRRSVLIAMTLLALATAWPALTMLANAPSFLMMLSVLLWLSFIYGMAQRGDDPGADRNYARRSARGRLLAGLQPGDRGVWRLHAGDFHGAD